MIYPPESLVGLLTARGANTAEAMERFMDDADLYRECIQLFVDDAHFPALGDALANCDCRSAFESAHALKGVAANLGFEPLLPALYAIVEPLRNGCCEGLIPLYADVLNQRDEIAAFLDPVHPKGAL